MAICWIIFAYILLLVVVIQDRKYRELYFGIMTKAFYVSDLVYPLKVPTEDGQVGRQITLLVLVFFICFFVVSFHCYAYQINC